ncbi:winged helix-turn-helix transcriptional regulator [Methylobacterium sp. Leaf118]|uniref:winged helix-turn-helix transcriptional regulator n=1 Tax=Methylobacterium sp. Leaf118 TaxID=2876562 RepID=UPI001E4BC2E6|nr:helix-turn-helix domain-containing protein [Methylobacterium sp. Leaf118]
MATETCTLGDTEQLVRLVLDQIADKWSILIIAALCRGPMRFNSLRRDVHGITQKSLTQALRRLERSGIIARRVIPVSPVAVEYSVTPLGTTLIEPFQALFHWASVHKEGIEAAQARFDREAGALVSDDEAIALRAVG